MNMEEDDLDFTPSSATSSKLASLFGSVTSSAKSNSSLMYTAPKQPKKETSPNKSPVPDDRQLAKLVVSNTIQAYKLEQGSYASQGKLGMTIFGSHSAGVYQLLLYRSSQDHVSKTKLTPETSVTVNPNCYVSFYDETQTNWSVMFSSQDDLVSFLKHFLVAKSHCGRQSLTKMSWQDVITSSEVCDSEDSLVVYTVHAVVNDTVTELPSERNCSLRVNLNLSNTLAVPWVQPLAGCGGNARKLILLPHSMTDSWRNKIPANASVLVDATIQPKPPRNDSTKGAPIDLDDSTVDSSNEESSIRARGANIKEALSATKSHKASLIHRMARMGQATLPLNNTNNLASDSEEDSSVSVSPKPRHLRNRPAEPVPVAPVAVYQSKAHDVWLQQQQQFMRAPYPPMVAVPAVATTPIASPTSDYLNTYLCESRTQATELRMGLSKVADKVDLVLNKVQDLNAAGRGPLQLLPAVATDPSGVLSSVQALVTENMSLRQKVDEQTAKLDQHSERIFHLLELNHRYLEESSNSKDKHSQSELKLLSNLKERETKLEETNIEITEKLRTALEQINTLKGENAELKKTTESLTAELEQSKTEVQSVQDVREKLHGLQEQLRASEEVKELQRKQVDEIRETMVGLVEDTAQHKAAEQAHHEEMAKVKAEKEELLKQLEEKNGELESKTLKVKSSGGEEVIQKLTQENEQLLRRIQRLEAPQEAAGRQNIVEEVKKVMNAVYRALQVQFSASEVYEGTAVRQALASTIRDVTLQFVDFKAQEKEVVGKDGSSQDTTTIQADHKVNKGGMTVNPGKEGNVSEGVKTAPVVQETARQEGSALQEAAKQRTDMQETTKQEKPAVKETIKEDNTSAEKVEVEHATYDQGWRSSKPPPPPPLFDDEDDDDDWLA